MESQAAGVVADLSRRPAGKHLHRGSRGPGSCDPDRERTADGRGQPVAYKEKYNRPGDIQYVKDLSRKKSRETTTELEPV